MTPKDNISLFAELEGNSTNWLRRFDVCLIVQMVWQANYLHLVSQCTKVIRIQNHTGSHIIIPVPDSTL